MAGCGGKNGAGNLYAALGVASDCSDAELRAAYRKLAMKWHPDKCAAKATGSSGGVEAAKARFQKIQGAYAVLSDRNKRILYDVGAYNSDGDDDGAGEILGDILEAMNKTAPHFCDAGERRGRELGGSAEAVRGAFPQTTVVLLLLLLLPLRAR
ncbi:chaperone protein DnaJ-like isoform X2 [Lolium rigidum]|uniref:chaperone protein DnaJ-like isoform X2 n=1 Tax=Lolium rigidum TaxID=89674 RepID=UPI001F5D3F00|nr:chaperone protein DnaJ-like isoform X2 [Lolium rigidum]